VHFSMTAVGTVGSGSDKLIASRSSSARSLRPGINGFGGSHRFCNISSIALLNPRIDSVIHRGFCIVQIVTVSLANGPKRVYFVRKLKISYTTFAFVESKP
jgi:hypothetical protein